MHFSIEESYWKNKAEQFMIQLGLPEGDRERISLQLFEAQPDNVIECMELILNEASSIRPETETISPHADDQEIHEALQQLPLALKSAVTLTVFHQPGELQQLIDRNDYEEGISRLSAQLDTNHQQTEKLLKFLTPTYEKIEMPTSRETVLPVHHEAPPEPKRQMKVVRTTASAVLVIGLLSGAMYLLGDPPVADEQSAQQAEDEVEPEDEKAFTEEEIEELEGAFEERKERLGEALSLTDEELSFMMVTQQAKSHLDYMKGMMNRDAGSTGPDVQQMKRITQDILAQMQPPMTLLRNLYDQAGGIDDDSNLIQSDQAVGMFLHAGADYLMAYERKLNDLIAENQNGEEELRDSNSDLFETISSHGMEVEIDDTNEYPVASVRYGGPELTQQTDYLHPDYQQLLRSMKEVIPGLAFYDSGEAETLDQVADRLLSLETLIMEFFSLQESLNEETGIRHRDYELQIPTNMSFQYTDQIRSVISDRMSPVRDGQEMSEQHISVWEYILNDEKFEGTRLRNVVSVHDQIAKQNDYKNMNGFGEVTISPFKDYIDPMNYHNYSTTLTLPLSGYLEELYKVFKTEGIDRIDFLHPQVVIVFYLHALETGDIETAYSLMGGEDLPDYETFVQTVSQYEYEFKRLTDVLPMSSSSQGMDFQVQQRENTLYFTVIESENWFTIEYESAEQFEELSLKEESDA